MAKHSEAYLQAAAERREARLQAERTIVDIVHPDHGKAICSEAQLPEFEGLGWKRAKPAKPTKPAKPPGDLGAEGSTAETGAAG